MGLCAAFDCKETGVYKFPSNSDIRRKWERALRRVNFKSSSYTRLCGKHFKESDFKTTSKATGFPLQRKFLKKNVVPSIFSWTVTKNVNVGESQADRLQRRNIRRCLIPSPSQLVEVESPITTEPVLLPSLEIGQEVELGKPQNDDDNNASVSGSQNNSQSTQTTTSFRLFTKDDLLIDSETIHYYTGLESYEKFKLVLSTLCPMAYDIKYKGSQVINMDVEDQFLILLMKLRRNKSDFELSKYFGVSKTVISNVFITWLNFTYDLWSLIDIWPERDLIDYYMPSQFKKDFSNSRIIIDGTEIPIAKPKNHTSQQATFSTYKNKNTVKFLVGATPGGLFSYCSGGYGGSTSDRQMIERSDLISNCESGDSIMADRGFNVQDIFASKGIGINIPAFMKGKSQLSGVRVKKDRKLASQRVHIERLIGLSKTYTILKTELNAFYVPLASRIFFVCVMLCNFREGIVNNK